MKLRDSLTRKNIIIGSSILLVGLVVAGFFALRRPPRVAMERYVPAEALAYIEIDSLAGLLDGLTNTTAWRELAPVLGLSSQLKQIGFVADLIGRTGLGPDEAVVAGRAQYAIAITAIESKAGETDESAYIHLKPHFALIIESHMKPAAAARLVRERAAIIAQRIYGESVQDSDDYRGTQVLIFRGPEPGRQMLAAASGSVILIANQADAMKSCLDVVAGGAAALTDDPTLNRMRPELDRSSASVFAYVTESGIGKLVELWPALIAGRSVERETVGSFADLVEHLSKQAGAALLYDSQFERGGVTERYLTVLRPQLAEALAQPLKPASTASFESLPLVPRKIDSLTLLNVERAGELPERVLKQLSPTIDIVAGVALREFVISFRKQYGLEPSDRVGDAVGSEVALINFGDERSRAMLVRVNDKSQLLAAVTRYLTRKGASVTNEQYNGTQIMVSSGDDRRSAAFVSSFLVLGTRDQIAAIIEADAKRDGIDREERLRKALANRPEGASIISYRPRVEDTGEFLLAISKLTRVTDGSHELLERDAARKALDQLPRSVIFTEFRSYGMLIETHSAVGNFSLLTSLMNDDDKSR